jgi:hypothetical protein
VGAQGIMNAASAGAADLPVRFRSDPFLRPVDDLPKDALSRLELDTFMSKPPAGKRNSITPPTAVSPRRYAVPRRRRKCNPSSRTKMARRTAAGDVSTAPARELGPDFKLVTGLGVVPRVLNAYRDV